MEEERGLVFLIQRYSVQDGPGLRTTIFMKGCPLRCQWCQNPESLSPQPELMTHDTKCMLLGKCAEVCAIGAITLDKQKSRKIDRSSCDLCFDCVAACPTKALSKVGDYMTVPEVMVEIERDELFYHRSDGGVTISGGEPLLQWSFVRRLLEACKQRNLHTALDTCGYAQWPVLEKVTENVDLILYDIKHMDPEFHKKVTGKSNRLILQNLRRIHPQKKVWLRFPLIPGFNDTTENIKALGKLGHELSAEKVSILPYHKLAEGKYRQLGVQGRTSRIKPPSKKQLQKVQAMIESLDLQVTIGS